MYAAVTLAFFSASGSKLAPYILPMMPVLAALAGIHAADPGGFVRRAARTGALLVLIVGVGLLVYSARRDSFVPHTAAAWVAAGVCAASAAVIFGAVRRSASVELGALVTVIAGVLAWQFLLSAYGAIPPARSARELAASVRPVITAQTPLYSVGQYRQTLSPYLARTLQLVGFEGELQFGLTEEPAQRLSPEEFAARWSAGGDAVAFFEPGLWDEWRRRGLPGRVIAADHDTVAVSRM